VRTCVCNSTDDEAERRCNNLFSPTVRRSTVSFLVVLLSPFESVSDFTLTVAKLLALRPPVVVSVNITLIAGVMLTALIVCIIPFCGDRCRVVNKVIADQDLFDMSHDVPNNRCAHASESWCFHVVSSSHKT
jgi:hypothetical protein